MIFKLTLFLLAGAIINVSVAWGCALLIPVSFPQALKWREISAVLVHDGQLVVERYDRPGMLFLSSSWSGALGGPLRTRSTRTPHAVMNEWERFIVDAKASDPTTTNVLVFASGWPLLTTWSWGHSIFVATDPARPRWRERMDRIYGGWDVRHDPDFHLPRTLLSWYPILPGFAINTIFYAAIVWMLFAVPGAVRRRVRIKRGQCASCGYSLRGSAGGTCPECGATA